MKLVNTRDHSENATFSHAVQVGMAGNNGLWVPTVIPRFPDVDALLDLDFLSRSAEIARRLLSDEFSPEELEQAVRQAFTFPAPLVKVEDGLFSLELFHGPTLAFKDFGARFLAQILGLIAKRDGGKKRTILTATSGDTGSAVAHAFWGLDDFRVFVLYPKGRISALQEKQFATLGGNVHALAVEGVFDDCQALVKDTFEDQALVKSLSLTSANSINMARLLGQVMYYFEALSQFKKLQPGLAPVLAVPCGNFGNLYAGLLAWQMGLPIQKFVIATNANKTVPEFLDTGQYRPRPSVATLSNAMDVGSPSNWERIMALFKGDRDAMRALFRWETCTDDETRRTLRGLHGKGYLCDPHAAVAYRALKENLAAGERGLFLATAHPAKFREIIEGELALTLELPAPLQNVMNRSLTSKEMPVNLDILRAELLSQREREGEGA